MGPECWQWPQSPALRAQGSRNRPRGRGMHDAPHGRIGGALVRPNVCLVWRAQRSTVTERSTNHMISGISPGVSRILGAHHMPLICASVNISGKPGNMGSTRTLVKQNPHVESSIRLTVAHIMNSYTHQTITNILPHMWFSKGPGRGSIHWTSPRFPKQKLAIFP